MEYSKDARFILLSDNLKKNIDNISRIIQLINSKWIIRFLFPNIVNNLMNFRETQIALKEKCLGISSRSIIQENDISLLKRSLVIKDAEIATLVKTKNNLIAENKSLKSNLTQKEEIIANIKLENAEKHLSKTVSNTNKKPVVKEKIINKASVSVNKKPTRGRPKKS